MIRAVACFTAICVCFSGLLEPSPAARGSEVKKEAASKTKVVKVETKGTVAGVGLDSIDITTKAGTAAGFSIVATTKIERNGKKAVLSDIQIGDFVEIEQIDGVTVKVEARGAVAPGTTPKPKTTKVETKGTVMSVGVDLIEVATTAGAVTKFYAPATTKIERNGKQAVLSDIQVGDLVEVEQVDGVTVEIEARGL